MIWIPLAIGAHFFWALVNLGDKYVVSKRVSNPYVYMVWLFWLGALVAVFIPFVDFVTPDSREFLVLLICSILYFFGGLPYIKAMTLEEPTRINVWWNLIPLFALILEWVAFNKQLSSKELLAFSILIIGAFVASIHIGQKAKFSKAIWYMLLACASFSLYAVLFGEVLETMPFVSAFIWVHMLMALVTMPMMIAHRFRKAMKKEIADLNKGTAALTFGVATLDHSGILLNQWALSLAPASLVFSFEGTQVVFVFIMASLLSIFAPHLIREEIDRKNILLKVVAIMIMIIGTLILTL